MSRGTLTATTNKVWLLWKNLPKRVKDMNVEKEGHIQSQLQYACLTERRC